MADVTNMDDKDLLKREDVSRLFSGFDIGIFVVMLLVSTGIGLYHALFGRRQNTTKEYLLAGKQMHWIPVGLSVLVTGVSGNMLLGLPTEIYMYGTMTIWSLSGYLISRFLVSYGYMPVFYQLELTSAYEYFELRFHRSLRLMASAMYTVQSFMLLATGMYGPALALSQVTGINVWVSVGLTGGVCTLYTCLGGMRAVIWTDVFQALIMLTSVISVMIMVTIEVGGFGEVWRRNVIGGRAEFDNIDPSPLVRHTLWSELLGGAALGIAFVGLDQAQIQRCLSTRNISSARKSLLSGIPGSWLFVCMCVFTGMLSYAYYWECDPILTNRIKKPDQIFPLLVMDTLGHIPGLPGLFVAGVFSAALSTMSSTLNSLSAITLEDFVKPRFSRVLSEEQGTKISKGLALLYGLLSMVMVLVVERFGNVLQATLTLAGVFMGPVTGLATLGMFVPRANTKGAMAGVSTALCLLLCIVSGTLIYKPTSSRLPVNRDACPLNTTSDVMSVIGSAVFSNVTTASTLVTGVTDRNEHILWVYRISYMWYTLLGILITLIVGAGVSYLTGGNQEEVDCRLLSPMLINSRNLWRKRNQKNLTATEQTKKIESSGDVTSTDLNGECEVNIFNLKLTECQ